MPPKKRKTPEAKAAAEAAAKTAAETLGAAKGGDQESADAQKPAAEAAAKAAQESAEKGADKEAADAQKPAAESAEKGSDKEAVDAKKPAAEAAAKAAAESGEKGADKEAADGEKPAAEAGAKAAAESAEKGADKEAADAKKPAVEAAAKAAAESAEKGTDKQAETKPVEKAAEKAKPVEKVAEKAKSVEKAAEKAKPMEPANPNSLGMTKIDMAQRLHMLRAPPSMLKKQAESKPVAKATEETKPKEASTELKKLAESKPVGKDETKPVEAADPQGAKKEVVEKAKPVEKPVEKAAAKARPVDKSKLHARVDNLQPGVWFKKQIKEWQASLSSWKNRHGQWNNPLQKKALLAIRADKKKANGEEDSKEIDADDLDVFAVEDVMDIGSGEPLFAKFAFEDWALLSLRFELHLLVHAFGKDVNDPGCAGFHESNLPFYYNKYFSKQWSNKSYGLDTFKDVCKLVKENISLTDDGVVKALLGEDATAKNFVHLTEEHRRDRQRLIDAGMESAELKFPKQAQAPTHSPGGGPNQQQGLKRPLSGGPTSSIQPAWKQAKAAPQQPKTGPPSLIVRR